MRNINYCLPPVRKVLFPAMLSTVTLNFDCLTPKFEAITFAHNVLLS